MAKPVNEIILADEIIMNKIYVVRGQKIMLDRDLAELYGVQAIRLREQVKRNINRFPDNFMFRLTTEEVEIMVSQNAIPSRKQLGGSLPYAFTEHGVLMLANVLKSEKALQVSIKVIEIFIRMREMLSTNKDILLQMQKFENKLTKHDEDIRLIFEALKQLLTPPQQPRQRIGFKP
ncbi:MAG TPA: ORF6N domain-containing protein [Hanamia sp.]|jgi:phage regulator Rha-like protein|nr:ORF6N domain-containing protein [Hanamia sp.]